MTDAELEVALRAYTRRRVFRPFLVEFVSGEQVRVTNREGLAPFGTVWLYRGPSLVQSLFPSSSVCRLADLPPGP